MSRARTKRGRAVDGILVLDKPNNMTSNGALQHVRRLYNANKAGHTGSLDPLATGLLPICFGEATKVSAYLLDAHKTYRARCQLGVTTTTGDAAGEIVSKQAVPRITTTDLTALLTDFIGEHEQTPPMYSALKQAGKRLYELAYQGITVARQPRPIHIQQLKLLELEQETFTILVSCSKGTYIRVLVEDIGQALGCGAYLLGLRRLAAGPFCESQMVCASTLQAAAASGFARLDELLLPMDQALTDLPAVYLSADQTADIQQGQRITDSRLSHLGRLRLYNHNKMFIGLGEATQAGQIQPKRLIN